MPWIGSAPNKTFQRTDGTRTGSEVWQEAKGAAVKIRADAADTHDQDIATGLGLALLSDGGTQPSADLPMNSKKHTGVADATARTNYASAGQVQDHSMATAATAGNDTITASLTPAITAYATGALYTLKAGGTNTGAATLNLNTVGAKTIKKGKAGSLDLVAGDFAAGRLGLFAYDGTNMQLLNAPEFPSGTTLIFQQTTAPTGWTKNTTHNDKALRIVSGSASSGGSTAFSTVFASRTPAGTVGATTLDVTQIPAHAHSFIAASSADGSGPNLGSGTIRMMADGDGGAPQGNAIADGLQNTGGGGSHTHSFTGTAMDFAVQYVDCVSCTKD
jgi:hypothetical protein